MKTMKKGLHIAVLIAFLVGVIAPACGFVWGGKYSVIEICTAQGIESRVVNNDDLPKSPHFEEQCQFCFSQANLKSLMPVLILIEKQKTVRERAQFSQYQDIVLSRLSQDHAARAPPAAV